MNERCKDIERDVMREAEVLYSELVQVLHSSEHVCEGRQMCAVYTKKACQCPGNMKSGDVRTRRMAHNVERYFQTGKRTGVAFSKKETYIQQRERDA